MNRKYIIISVFLILSLFLFPTNFVKGATDISYTFDNNELVDFDTNDYNNTFNLQNISYFTGNYNGTYSFENDIDGTFPLGWNIDEGGGSIQVFNNFNEHNKVILINDTKADDAQNIDNDFDSTITNGIVEFWFSVNSVTETSSPIFVLKESTIFMVYIRVDNDDIDYRDNSDVWISIVDDFVTVNTWIHLSISLDDSANTFNISINNILEGSLLEYNHNSTIGIDNFLIGTGTGDVEEVYIDAIGYSWQIGKWDFENDIVGNEPKDWNIQSFGTGVGTVERFQESNVFKINDDDVFESVDVSVNFMKIVDQNIQYDIAINDITLTEWYGMSFNEGGNGRISLRIDNNDLDYNDGIGWFSVKDDFIIVDTWFEINIIMDDTANTFDIYIDGNLEGNNLDYFSNSVVSVDGLLFATDAGQESITYIDNFLISSLVNVNYYVDDNLLPNIEVDTSLNQINAYEFIFNGSDNPLNPGSLNHLADVESWIITGVYCEIQYDLNSLVSYPTTSQYRDRILRFNMTGSSDSYVNKDNLGLINNFISITTSFNISTYTNNGGEFVYEIYDTSDLTLNLTVYKSGGIINFGYHDGSSLNLLYSGISLNTIYELNILINFEIDIAFIIIYESGVQLNNFYIPLQTTSQTEITEIIIGTISNSGNTIVVNLDYVGLFSNGTTSIEQDSTYGYIEFKIPYIWNFENNNLFYFKGIGNLQIYQFQGIGNRDYIPVNAISHTLDFFRTHNDTTILNNIHDLVHTTTSYNSLVIYTKQNISIDNINIQGVILKEGINEYILDFEHSGVDIDESYFYVDSSNRLQFRYVADDTNLEYIQATFDINDVNSSDYAFSFRSDMVGNAYGYIRVNYTDISQIIPIPYTLTTTRFLLSQDKIVRDIIILITDKDNNVITGLTTGYIYNIELIDVIDIDVSIITESLLNMMIPLIIILVPTFLFSSRFGKQVIVPLFILFSLVLTISGLIPYWLFFVIVFPSIIMVFFKSKKEVI